MGGKPRLPNLHFHAIVGDDMLLYFARHFDYHPHMPDAHPQKVPILVLLGAQGVVHNADYWNYCVQCIPCHAHHLGN